VQYIRLYYSASCQAEIGLGDTAPAKAKRTGDEIDSAPLRAHVIGWLGAQ
jgi:hypothetical protein